MNMENNLPKTPFQQVTEYYNISKALDSRSLISTEDMLYGALTAGGIEMAAAPGRAELFIQLRIVRDLIRYKAATGDPRQTEKLQSAIDGFKTHPLFLALSPGVEIKLDERECKYLRENADDWTKRQGGTYPLTLLSPEHYLDRYTHLYMLVREANTAVFKSLENAHPLPGWGVIGEYRGRKTSDLWVFLPQQLEILSDETKSPTHRRVAALRLSRLIDVLDYRGLALNDTDPNADHLLKNARFKMVHYAPITISKEKEMLCYAMLREAWAQVTENIDKLWHAYSYPEEGIDLDVPIIEETKGNAKFLWLDLRQNLQTTSPIFSFVARQIALMVDLCDSVVELKKAPKTMQASLGLLGRAEFNLPPDTLAYFRFQRGGGKEA